MSEVILLIIFRKCSIFTVFLQALGIEAILKLTLVVNSSKDKILPSFDSIFYITKSWVLTSFNLRLRDCKGLSPPTSYKFTI